MKSALKYVLQILVIVCVTVLIAFASKAFYIYALYAFFLGKIYGGVGWDLEFARIPAILATVAALMATPWIFSFFFFNRHKKEVMRVVAVLSLIWALGLYFGEKNIFFDRETGKPAKYYIKTLHGFKFSSRGDYDPQLGAKYKPITPEVVREYFFWKQTGKIPAVSEVNPGRFFDMITGEPMVWYIVRPEGDIQLFPLPGYDPLTGELLKPVTKEVILKLGRGLKNVSSTPTGLVPVERKLVTSFKKSDSLFLQIDQEALEWYFQFKCAQNLRGERLSLGRDSPFWGRGAFIHEYDVYAERILFCRPSFTILGICFQAVQTSKASVQGALIDGAGVKYEPKKILVDSEVHGKVEKWVWLKIGEVKRVLYVFDYIPPEKLHRGGLSLGNFYITFENDGRPGALRDKEE